MTSQIEDIKRAAYYEAVRIAHKLEPDMSAAEFSRLHLNVAHDMLRRAMMEELAPLMQANARAYALIPMAGFVLKPDGKFEIMPVEVPAELKPMLAEVDRLIGGIRQKYTEAAKCATLGESRRCMPA